MMKESTLLKKLVSIYIPRWFYNTFFFVLNFRLELSTTFATLISLRLPNKKYNKIIKKILF